MAIKRNDTFTPSEINAVDLDHRSDWSETDAADPAFIRNKPTIADQVQADWNTSGNTAKSFIKNKPAFLTTGLPTSAGNYQLTVTVTNDTPTYTWTAISD